MTMTSCAALPNAALHLPTKSSLSPPLLITHPVCRRQADRNWGPAPFPLAGQDRRLHMVVPIIGVLSALNALMRLSTGQKAITVLHVLFSGFKDPRPWADWVSNHTRSLQRSSIRA